MKTSLLAALVIAGVQLTGCSKEQPANTATETNKTTTTAPTKSNENPLYESWHRFKKGTETDYELTIHQGGGETKMPLHYTLVELDATNATIELNLPAGARVTVPAQIDKNGAKVKDWPGLLYQVGYLPLADSISGHETIEAGGQKYNCEWGETDIAGMKVKQWFCRDVPGKLVKSHVDAKDQGIQMEEVLTEVKTPKE